MDRDAIPVTDHLDHKPHSTPHRALQPAAISPAMEIKAFLLRTVNEKGSIANLPFRKYML
ncbi:hypothetical protein MPNT_330009 [Candidatus Methylacidithermus pantelleriae]|uniref:Uncharacterized protein n=1 Tax=Candidatus Methylacidithermus pantelleriae TaxID=2744239 RepID=A0A8J2FWM0_9BACT|nr:hypothetical protein MPNT_330009 [Candidatus Methylacidithermus pantelleriae]